MHESSKSVKANRVPDASSCAVQWNPPSIPSLSSVRHIPLVWQLFHL